MMTLRQRIQAAIEPYKDNPEDAAIVVLRLLDDEGFSLFGNGWIDDDPVVMKALGYGE